MHFIIPDDFGIQQQPSASHKRFWVHIDSAPRSGVQDTADRVLPRDCGDRDS